VNANTDIESSLSIDEKNAYKALIEGCAAKTVDADNNFDVDNDIDDLKKSFRCRCSKTFFFRRRYKYCFYTRKAFPGACIIKLISAVIYGFP
jgi:hypothetical protein